MTAVLPHTPPSLSRRHPARLGLLLVALVMGFALVATSLASFAGARVASAAIAETTAETLVRSVRRELLLAGEGDLDATVAGLVEDLTDQGVRFVGLVERDGTVRASAGTALDDLHLGFVPMAGRRPTIASIGRNATRALVPLLPGPGAMGGRRIGAWLRPEWRRTLLVIDFEPTAARNLSGRAAITLLLSLVTAIALLVASLVFWRMSRRAEAIELQLQRDQQLKALGQMSAVLGHELRNPLASLKGHAQLLVEQLPVEQPARAKAELVVREAERIEALSNQVLDFSRTGSLDLALADPLAIARAAIERAQVAPVEVVAPETLPPWPVDRPRLEQVLLNLLTNARQASDPSAPIQVRLAIAGDWLQIEVRDRGAGIEPGDEDKIFEPFFTRRVQGTGLGLALARRIVEGHGGRISALNHAAGGALFRIELPRPG